VVQGDQAFLHVDPGAHLLGAAEQDPDASRPHFAEKGEFGGVAIVILDKGDFRLGNPTSNQL
jgi:hypothetical protein